MMRSRSLDRPIRPADLPLNRLSLKRTSKLFILRLPAPYCRHSQHLFVTILLVIEHSPDHLPRLLTGFMRGVPLLPQEFPRPQEGGGVFELPPDDIGPLVDFHG